MSKNRDPKHDAKPPQPKDVPLALPEDAAELDLAGLSDSAITGGKPPTAPGGSSVFDLNLRGIGDSGSIIDFGPDKRKPIPAALDSSNPAGFAMLEGGSDLDLPALVADDSGSGLGLAPIKAKTPPPDTDVYRRDDVAALDAAIPGVGGASSSSLFGDAPRAATADDSSVANLEPLTPLQPASGWFDSQPGELPPLPDDDIEATLAADPLSGRTEGSDIFALSGFPEAKPNTDMSDVIAATAYGPAKPVKDEPRAKISSSRPSDIALTFDQPPGGSTMQDEGGDADLPMASEVSDSADSLFGDEDDMGSGRPSLPGDLSRRDDADLGATPTGTIDASSIMADLSEPSSLAGDSSAIRIEAPGIDATLEDEPFARANTEPDMNLPEAYDSGDPTDWHSQSGSDLFDDARPRTEFELVPDAGVVDPFADDATVDQPSLSTAPSSIFSGGKIPGGNGSTPSSGASVPVANPDNNDSVEFSDHPDPNAADSGSFHVLPAGAIDFDISEDLHPERSMRAAIPEDDADAWAGAKTDPGPASGYLTRRTKATEPTDEMAPIPATPVKGKPTSAKKSDPSVELNWVADSAEQAAPTALKSKPSGSPDRSPSESGASKRGVAGVALGLLLGVGVSAGAYFSGAIPNKDDPKPIVNNGGGTNIPLVSGSGTAQPAPATLADAQSALSAGDPAKAVKVIETLGAKTPEDKAALGQARMFARFRELAQTNTVATADDAELKKARADLESVVNDADAAKTPEGEKAAIRAALHLGLTHEVAGDRAKAKAVYEDGAKKFPKAAEAFQAALDRLTATAPDANKTSLRLTPAEAEQLASAVVILLALDTPPALPAEEPAEAGAAFWKAVNFAKSDKYDDAIKQIVEAKKAHEKRAKALAGRGLNPLSDPLEQIFPRSCDDLKSNWELRKSLYEHPGVGVALKKDLTKTLDALAGAEKRAVDAANLAADLKTMRDDLAVVLKSEKEKVAKAEKDLTGEKEKVTTSDKALKAEKVKVVEFEKTEIAMKETYRKNEAAIRLEVVKQNEQIDGLKLKERNLKTTVDAIAKELQNGKLLPEKFDDAALVAATKSTVSRATGPDLSKLVPPELSAIAGTGLTTGHLLDLAAHVNKAEAATKAAEAKISTLKTEQIAEMKKVTAAQAVELQKVADAATVATDKLKKNVTDLKDAQAIELKKAADAAAVAADKLKSEQAAKLKEAADKYSLDAKAQADANAEKVKSLESAVALEKARATEADRRLKALGGAAVAASQQLDAIAIQAAARNLDAGITAYRGGNYAAAEKALVEAAKFDPNDALAWYFLGATRWANGKTDEAKADFKQGAEREQLRIVPTRQIDSSLSPIQGPARDALSAVRP